MTHDPDVRSMAALVHGRYLLQAAEGAGNDAPLLVGCHGYAEGALDHLAALRKIPGIERFHLCAVQALHPFYRRDGSVVWNWMTKEDRGQAIEDNIRYVTSVIVAARRELGAGPRLVLAGFSQGVAMAWRAAVRCGLPCHGLIVLAADVPADVAALEPPVLPPVLLGRGTEDSWYSEAKMDADLETLGRLGADVTQVVFEGGHEWHPEFLAATGTFLDRIADHP